MAFRLAADRKLRGAFERLGRITALERGDAAIVLLSVLLILLLSAIPALVRMKAAGEQGNEQMYCASPGDIVPDDSGGRETTDGGETTNGTETEHSEAPSYAVPSLDGLAESDFVKISDYIPGAEIELIYATDENFTGERIYDFTDAYLRCGTVKKLLHAELLLEERGLRLKIWDAFRPYSAQCRLWEICPDPAYVSDPESGRLPHCRGNTVDITLVGADGSELEMPSGFDEFSASADRDYADVSAGAAVNSTLLEDIMKQCGFSGYYGEWWHYSDTEDYPQERNFIPEP